MNTTCKSCGHYHLYQMITQGAYSYSGDIPCMRCVRYLTIGDEHTNPPENKES